MYNLSKNKQIILTIIILIIGLILIGFIYVLRYTNKRYYNGILSYLQDCIILHEDNKVEKITKYRGQRCYINKKTLTSSKKDKEDKEYNHKYCVTTFWSFSHLIFYAYLGFFSPSLLLELFVFNIFFEAYEKYTMEKNDILDIFYNTIGLLLGFILNKLYFKNDKHTVKSGIIIGIICFIILIIISIQHIFTSQKKHDTEYYNNQFKNILNTDEPNDTIYYNINIRKEKEEEKEILIDNKDEDISKIIQKKYKSILSKFGLFN